MAATRDKAALRARLAAGAVAQPEYRVVPPARERGRRRRPRSATPAWSSRSRGRGAKGSSGPTTRSRPRPPPNGVRAIVGPVEPLLVEGFVPGTEVAVEGLLVDGASRCWRCSTSPTRSTGLSSKRRSMSPPPASRPRPRPPWPGPWRRRWRRSGLREGPVHAELRVGRRRSAGGHRGGGSLDRGPVRPSVALRGGRKPRGGHRAPRRRRRPRRAAPRGSSVGGDDAAYPGRPGCSRRCPAKPRPWPCDGVVGLEISIARGRAVVPLPEGDRYLGFVFARGRRRRRSSSPCAGPRRPSMS